MRDLVLFERAGERAVAQHDHPVGGPLDLVQAVRNEDDADALGLERGDDVEQLVGLGQRQAGGRLVENDKAGIDRQRLGDLDHLPLRQRKVCQRASDGLKPAPRRCRYGAAILRCLSVSTSRSEAAAPRLAADEDIGGDVEIVEEVEFLMHEGDAGAHAGRHGERRLLDAIDGDRAGVGRRSRRPESSSGSICRRRFHRRGR